MAWKREEAATVVSIWDMSGVGSYGEDDLHRCESGNQGYEGCEHGAEAVHCLMARPRKILASAYDDRRADTANQAVNAHLL